MHKIIIIFFILLLSCQKTNQKDKSVNSKLILSLIEQYILTDSLNYHGFIISELQPYEYYELQFTDDSLRYPPPSGFNWMNETAVIEQIDLDSYFNDSVTRTHVKNQIVSSKELVDNLSLSSLGDDKLGLKFRNEESWYTFYLPIFNADSSAVYMQYDHFDNGYGEGNAAIFIKKDGKWIYLKFLPGWMT